MQEIRVAIFESTHETMKGEKYFEESNIPFRPTIAPREIIAGCAMGLEFHPSRTKMVVSLCKKEGLRLKAIYENSNSGWKSI